MLLNFSAIGDLMSMSAETPKHLFSIGLLEKLVEGDKQVSMFYHWQKRYLRVWLARKLLLRVDLR